jgi:hypothetical protein
MKIFNTKGNGETEKECRENGGKFQYKDLTLKEMGKRKKNREREIKNHAFLKSFLEAKR